MTIDVSAERWFGSKSQEITGQQVLERVPVDGTGLDIALLEVEFAAGTHELYQLVLDGERDAAADERFVRALVDLMREGRRLETSNGCAVFAALDGLDPVQAVRPMGAEQSNSSLVLDERAVLKVYRRLGAGPNPELEILRFLSARGFEHIATLRGFYAHTGRLIDATLGIVQDFVTGAGDGWDLALGCLRDGEPFAPAARELGEVTGKLHTALASDAQDPAFSPEETSAEALGLLTATVDEEIEQVFLDLPDDEALEPIRGRAQEVRERLSLLTQAGSAGRVIRHHGDFHLGQVLRGSDGRWVVLDFEGEPARTLVERRGKRSPLRDVAGMLRSFAYAATASELDHGTPAPEGWEHEMREAFLAGYLECCDRSLLPPGRAAVDRLLAVFELEKAVYELRYELDNRPDWVKIPVAGIARLLDLDAEEVA
jgi:predicted trehalose synthase